MTPQFTLSSDALPVTNRLRAVRGTERLSQPYAFDLVVELEPNALEDLDAPVGQPATISFNDEDGVEQDAVHGILATWELVDAQPERELYLARLVPRLWWLGQNRHSRVFVDDTLPTIIGKVLRSAGWGDDDFRLVLKGRPKKGHPPIEHVCQYRESDLDFLSRWMEREGIYYYFEEAAPKKGASKPEGPRREALVVTDDAEAHRERVAGPRAYVPRSAAGGDRIEGFRTFRRTSHAQPAGVRLADYDYLNPTLPVQHQEKTGDGQLVSLFGENLATVDDAKWLTQLRVQELRAQQVTYRGAGRVHGIHPADTFSLTGHTRLTEQMLAVEVVHRGMDLGGKPGLREPIEEALGEELDDGYAVEVTAIPATVQYRPARVTPTPRITGMEFAVVDGEADDRYAQLDEHGRYKLRLKFDESDLEDGKASTRVRMMQPHGGAEEGFHFPLRKSTEVMVAFVGGHPDRPIIAGVTPNAHALSLVTRANATQNVIQTGGGNRLVMEDTAGSQSVDLRSPVQSSFLHLGAGENNLELSTDGIGRIHTGGDLTVDVGGARTDHVTKDLTETYDAAQKTEAKTREETVHGTVTETYEGKHTQTVTTGGALREVTGATEEKIHGKLTETVDGGLDQTINGGMVQKINNGTVKIEAVGPLLNIHATAGINLTSDGPIRQDGKTSLLVNVPAKIEIADLKGTLCKSVVFTVTPLSYSTAGVNVGIHPVVSNLIGTKAEVHGIKLDYTKVYIHNKPLDLMDVKMRIVAGVLALQLYKFVLLGR